jgi:two-component system phosphate regulon sensor histidine kinase PhoR
VKPLRVLIAVAAAVAGGYAAAYQQWPLVLAAATVVAALTAFAMRVPPAPAPAPAAPPPPPAADTPATIGLESLESAAMLIDRDYSILAMNAAAVDAFGQHPTGEDIRVAIRHPAVIECVTTAIRQNREAVREVEGLGRQAAVFRLRVATAGEGRLLLVFADVSPARLAERMRADFVANASHELRTPLATLVGFIETLQGPAAHDEATRARFLQVMEAEAARMTRLIDDLLSLSRIELDKNIRPREIIALEPLFSNIAATSAVALDADRRRLELNVAPELPDVIADRDQILQVLHNLITNAIKYGRSGTPIVLTAERARLLSGDAVRVSVSDRGDGIEPEHIPRLTERFYRVDTGRSRRLGGTGLGLAIVKHIVERHRGTLEIHSELGKGTTVAFTLPAAMSQI